MLGALLCRIGWHKRRTVRWKERGTVRRADGVTQAYEYTLSGYRCERCEPIADITNDPIIRPSQPTGGR